MTLRTRWKRARARLLAFESDITSRGRDSARANQQERLPPCGQWLSYGGYDYRQRDRATVKKHLAASHRLLFKSRHDAGLTEKVMTRLENQLDQLWAADDWKKRHNTFRSQLTRESGALEAFDDLVTAGCYADLVAAGVTEATQSMHRRTRPSPEVRRQTRHQAQQLATGLSELAEGYATAVKNWPGNSFPVFNSTFAATLQNEAHRLTDLVDALDLRHGTGVRPRLLTMFLAAVRHAKDVTGTYRDSEFAKILDGLGVTSNGEPVSEELIAKWRQRVSNAERHDLRRPMVDRLRESWT